MSIDTRRYQVVAAVGKGGFGTVYKADLLGPGGFRKRVALKVLNPEVAEADDIAERLRDEARLLGLLEHRSIVRVDGMVLLNGRWTVVMEFVEGADLRRLLSVRPMPVGCALELIEEVAHALHSAYEQPVQGHPLRLLHRDLKPSNLLLTRAGEVKILDFGVARAEFEDREAVTRNQFYGSLGYMSPERQDGIDTHAGDVYALGVVLFELIAGRQLGRAPGHPERYRRHVEEALVGLQRVQVPEPVLRLLSDCLSFDPEHRPPARELARRARLLRAGFPEPWLRDWAEEAVPPLLMELPRVEEGMTGTLLFEDSMQVTEVMSTRPEPAGAPLPPLVEGPTASAAGGGAGLLAGLLASMVGLLAVVAVVAVGGLGWWALSDREPSPVPPAPSPAQEALARELPAQPREAPPAPALTQAPAPAEPTAPSPSDAAPSTKDASPSSPREPARAQPPAEPEEEEPAEEPAEPAPEPAAAAGQVRVTGDARNVTLRNSTGTFPPGALPPGSYTVYADFNGEVVEAGALSLAAGQVITLSCRAGLRRCTLR